MIGFELNMNAERLNEYSYLIAILTDYIVNDNIQSNHHLFNFRGAHCSRKEKCGSASLY